MSSVYNLITATEFTTCKNFISVIGFNVTGFNFLYSLIMALSCRNALHFAGNANEIYTKEFYELQLHVLTVQVCGVTVTHVKICVHENYCTRSLALLWVGGEAPIGATWSVLEKWRKIKLRLRESLDRIWDTPRHSQSRYKHTSRLHVTLFPAATYPSVVCRTWQQEKKWESKYGQKLPRPA